MGRVLCGTLKYTFLPANGPYLDILRRGLDLLPVLNMQGASFVTK